MKIYLMTDMEGCAGILNHDDWVMREGRWYEAGRRILTEETNAVVDGFFAGGATEVIVSDGHGAGGIDPLLLDDRAQLLRGYTGYPLELDKSFDALGCVGQHAKAGTDYSHITHTQWFNRIDETINGISIGEYGEFFLCGMELGIPAIFAAGEEAFTHEAQDLTPGVVTVSVKRGTKKDGLDDLSTEDYATAKLNAIHLSHAEACRRLKRGAEDAVRRFKKDRSQFRYPTLQAPFVRITRFRSSKNEPAWTSRTEHPTSLIALMNMPYQKQP